MLTQKQKEVLDYLIHYQRINHISPSFDEIKEAVHLKSKSGIHRLVDALVERGYIAKLSKRARAIEILRLPESPSDRSPEQVETRLVPLLGKVAAGIPIEAICNTTQEIEGIDYLHLPLTMLKKEKKYFGLKIDGDSMCEAGILDGDIALFSSNYPSPRNGEIVAALVNGEEITLKYFYKNGPVIELRPGNKNYTIQKYQSDKIQIQGKLEALWRNYS